jgi:hypothetical protein
VTGRPRFHLQSEVEDVVCGKRGGVLCMVLVYCVSTWKGDSSEPYLWLRFCASRRRVATSWRTRRRASDALCKETRFVKSITLHGSALARQQTTCREERLGRWGVCLPSWQLDAGAGCRTQHGAIGWRSSNAAPSKHGTSSTLLCTSESEACASVWPSPLYQHHVARKPSAPR